LRRLLTLERGYVDAVLLRKFLCGLRWRRDRRTGDELFEIRLTLGDANNACRQTTWRAVGLGAGVTGEPRLFEACVYVLGHLRRQPWQPPGGNFLATDLDQELAVHRLL